MTPPLLRAADLRGAARLTTDAVLGVTDLVEAMHARIAGTPGLRQLQPAPPNGERTRGLTGFVYRTVRGLTRLAGGGAEALLAAIGAGVDAHDPALPVRPEREALVAALNGVFGDHLAATGNPLAIEMHWRHAGRVLPAQRAALQARLGAATPRLLVLVHGLCMNDLQWRRAGHDHGEALARDLGYTPVHLVYNSGLGIPANGQALARCLEGLCEAWPVPLERLAIVGHSMGGLVARSAVHHASAAGAPPLRWPSRLDDLVYLGTPHHGAPLERAGHGVDVVLAAVPYAAPLARLGRARSAGIVDLRHGRVAEGAGPPVALPVRTRCHAIAASLGPAPGRLKARLLGDGLVPVASALGEHRDPLRRLDFAAERRAVVHDTGHLDLLSSAEVSALLARWLA